LQKGEVGCLISKKNHLSFGQWPPCWWLLFKVDCCGDVSSQPSGTTYFYMSNKNEDLLSFEKTVSKNTKISF